MEELEGIQLELKASMKTGDQVKRPGWKVGRKAMELLLEPKLMMDTRGYIGQALGVDKNDKNEVRRMFGSLDRAGRAVKKRCDEVWPELAKKLTTDDFSDPWAAWMAKKLFLSNMRVYLAMKRIGERLAAFKG